MVTAVNPSDKSSKTGSGGSNTQIDIRFVPRDVWEGLELDPKLDMSGEDDELVASATPEVLLQLVNSPMLQNTNLILYVIAPDSRVMPSFIPHPTPTPSSTSTSTSTSTSRKPCVICGGTGWIV